MLDPATKVKVLQQVRFLHKQIHERPSAFQLTPSCIALLPRARR
jgi:hypothetical protein